MKTAKVALNELYNHLRRPGFWISTLLVPLLLLGFSLFPGNNLNPESFASGSGPSRVAFVDESGVTFGVLEEMPQGEADNYRRYPSEGGARAAVDSGEISGYYLIPGGYPESGELRHYSDSFNPFASGGESERIETLLSASLVEDRSFSYAQRLAQPVSGLAVKDLESGSATGDSNAAFALGFLFALLLYISIFSSSNFLLRAVVEEKENRLMEILLSSAPPKALLRGKMVGLGVLGLLQVSLWVAAGYLVLGGSGRGFLSDLTVSPAGWALALVCFLFGYAMYAALMAAVGSVATTMRESSQLVLVVIVPIILPVIFLSILIQQPGGILAQILSYIPLTAPVTLPVRQVAGGIPAPQLVVSFALMALTVLLLQSAATRIFRAHTLLSGSRPSLGAVLRALR